MSRPTTPPAGLGDAQTAWQRTFAGGPYTALVMVDYLLKQGGKSADNFMQDPKGSLKNVTKTRLTNKTITDMAVTWANKTGRCTSFAVKITHELRSKLNGTGQPLFDFEIFDIGRHRVARCRNTGILIDSSSAHPGGAFVLAEGAWHTFPETKASWKYVKESTSSFSRNGLLEAKDVKTTQAAISAADAMKVCLKEIEEVGWKSIPTLFRSIDASHQGEYHGLIGWNVSGKVIELKETIADKTPTRIVWDPASQGTQATMIACVTEIENFVKVFGGPHGATQWVADNLDGINLELIEAANKAWGYPKLVPKTV